MRKVNTLALVLSFLFASNSSFAGKTCAELKEAIDANIYGNGVRGYALELLPSAEAELELSADSGAKVVGSCGGGTQKLVYWRDGKSSTVTPTSSESEPEAQTMSQIEKSKSPYSTLEILIAQ